MGNPSYSPGNLIADLFILMLAVKRVIINPNQCTSHNKYWYLFAALLLYVGATCLWLFIIIPTMGKICAVFH